jgi:hypothetical protein
MLTEQKLKEMKDGQIISFGEGNYPLLDVEKIRWIAVRGKGFHDWAIYYDSPEKTFEEIIKFGAKCFTSEMIKILVPCDQSAFELYRN